MNSLKGLHFLLTYTCLYKCDHCFLHCGPNSEGTFTIDALEKTYDQAIEAGITSVYFEGGEPFLFYPILLEALRLAKSSGLRTGLVTNCYWATTVEDAKRWLSPIAEIGLDDLSVSNDAFHADDPGSSPALIVKKAAEALELPVMEICIDSPTNDPTAQTDPEGAVIGGDVLFKGRAAEELAADLKRRPFELFDSCPHEELEHPGRVHLDPFGNVFVCQGISIGNIWRERLIEIMTSYRPRQDPIIGPLLEGGPAKLALVHGLPEGKQYVDHCHLCYLTRKRLLDRFPHTLCPTQVYGL